MLLTEASDPASLPYHWSGDVIFIPGDLPRQGRIALWGTGAGTGKIELVFEGGTYGVRKRHVTATLVPIADALPWLLAFGAGPSGDPRDPAGWPVRRTLAVWAAAASAAVSLVARGRILPSVGSNGNDAWRVGPLDAADLVWLSELAAAFPPAAHALAVPGSRPMRLRSPESFDSGDVGRGRRHCCADLRGP